MKDNIEVLDNFDSLVVGALLILFNTLKQLISLFQYLVSLEVEIEVTLVAGLFTIFDCFKGVRFPTIVRATYFFIRLQRVNESFFENVVHLFQLFDSSFLCLHNLLVNLFESVRNLLLQFGCLDR